MFTSDELIFGQTYTRDDLRDLFDITDATIKNGIFPPKGHESVWLFITEEKTKDRTQYNDLLVGDLLYWESQPTGRKDHLVIDHHARGIEILVFYRKAKYEFPHAAFRYEGQFRYVSHTETTPRRFLLERVSAAVPFVELEKVAVADEQAIAYETAPDFEGGVKQRYTNYYERNPKLRAQAITIHGTTCKGCGFNFKLLYGERGANFIEVHHLRPVSSLGESALVNPRTDLTVLCSNCHRIVHRRRDDVLTIEHLRSLIKGRRLAVLETL